MQGRCRGDAGEVWCADLRDKVDLLGLAPQAELVLGRGRGGARARVRAVVRARVRVGVRGRVRGRVRVRVC